MLDTGTNTFVFACTGETGVFEGPNVYLRRATERVYAPVTRLFCDVHLPQSGSRHMIVTAWFLGKSSHLFCSLGAYPPYTRHPVTAEASRAREQVPLLDLRVPEAEAPADAPGAPRGIQVEDIDLIRIDLRTFAIERWAERALAPLPIIAELVGTDATDDLLFAVAGFARRSRHLSDMDYALASFSWEDRTVRRRRRMPNIWF
jgi:hypothetical protein